MAGGLCLSPGMCLWSPSRRLLGLPHGTAAGPKGQLPEGGEPEHSRQKPRTSPTWPGELHTPPLLPPSQACIVKSATHVPTTPLLNTLLKLPIPLGENPRSLTWHRGLAVWPLPCWPCFSVGCLLLPTTTGPSNRFRVASALWPHGASWNSVGHLALSSHIWPCPRSLRQNSDVEASKCVPHSSWTCSCPQPPISWLVASCLSSQTFDLPASAPVHTGPSTWNTHSLPTFPPAAQQLPSLLPAASLAARPPEPPPSV